MLISIDVGKILAVLDYYGRSESNPFEPGRRCGYLLS